ncbi:hypothetical protein HanIR_Chr17g0855621 [Helianthus annuus]|nr:hypothetical protein HanIR_Chr17g0855621 [Helianthus annuus]
MRINHASCGDIDSGKTKVVSLEVISLFLRGRNKTFYILIFSDPNGDYDVDEIIVIIFYNRSVCPMRNKIQ